MILLRMLKSWYGKENTKLTSQLKAELPAILLWAIMGWQRLRDRGHFIQPESSKELIEEMNNLSSPVRAFLRERCNVDPVSEIERGILFRAYQQWCEEQGQTRAGTAAVFGRDLRASIPTIRTTQHQTDTGVRPKYYVGIALKN